MLQETTSKTYPASKRLIIIFLSSILFISTLLLYHCTQPEDTRFESYTSALFRQEVSGNAITLHYTLKNPENYRISTIPVNLGRVSTDTDSIGAAAENALAILHKYNPDKLSQKNQLTYQLLEDTFTHAIQMAPYSLYEEPLSPLTGTQAQLPILLSEYQFYTREDVNTYLLLLKNLTKYFQEIMAFETAKAEAGLFMTESRADEVIEECNAFVTMGNNNYLHTTFQNRITGLHLSRKEYDSYIEQNSTIIENYLYPAYELLKSHLMSLRNRGTNQNGLYYFPKGKDYYELLVNEMTGSQRTILEMQALTLRQITKDLDDMQDVLTTQDITASDADASDSDVSTHDTSTHDIFTQPNILQDSNPTSILTILKEKITGNFPTPPNVNISVKYVDESMEDYLSPAFYLIPAIDNSKENVIYVNPQHMTDDISLFTTLAHEGYPGHLYQTTCFANMNPEPIRHLLSCDGYVEGWATYCEMMSYYFLPEILNSAVPASTQNQQQLKSEITIMQKNSSVMLGLYALADMGIHYEGWTLTDTIDFFRNYGIYDNNAIEEIFNLIIGDPANYLKYYIGYVEFLELKKDAVNAWGDKFSQERFHKEVLDAGPITFDLLRKKMGLS